MARGRQNPDDWDIDYDPTSEIDNTWQRNAPAPKHEPPARPPGQPVTIEINGQGRVTSISLAHDWKQAIDPRDLHSTVLGAFNTAMMQAFATNAENIENRYHEHGKRGTDSQDTSPLSGGDVRRLLDEVYADLAKFTAEASSRIDHPVSAVSSGGHVEGTAQSGQVLDLAIDPKWASASRDSEVELELHEVLTKLSELSTPGTLAQGPQSRAIDELHNLVSDPQLFLSRIGLPQQP